MVDFKDAVVVITGAAGGIGLALAKAAQARGARLVIADIRKDALAEAEAELAKGGEVLAVQTDVADAEAVAALANAAYARFGKVTVLVNNAGVVASGLTWEVSEAAYDWVIGVNQKSVINGIRAFVPRMIVSGEPGHVVTIASGAGITVNPGFATYSMTKHAVVALTEALYLDLLSQGRLVVLPTVSWSRDEYDALGVPFAERGKILVDGTNIIDCSAKELYEIRTLFGVMFQDGALFGSMNIYDNTAFPLREHTKKSESDIRKIVMEKLEMVGLDGDENKFPGEISGGMKKRAGLARSLVLDPKIILCDEPDSGLDPVRTAYLSQLLIDINAQIDATILIVTHNINIARTVPDNMGMLFRKHLVMFGPREVLLTSDEPVVKQFLNGRRIGPIGMSEEKDESTMAEEQAMLAAGQSDGGVEDIEGVPPQLVATPGMPERKAVGRRQARVREILHTLPPAAQAAILDDLEGTHKLPTHTFAGEPAHGAHHAD